MRTHHEKHLDKSDQWLKYKDQFIVGFESMIKRGLAKPQDFIRQSGFIRVINQQHIFYVYSGCIAHIRNRIYLNVITGEISHDISVWDKPTGDIKC